MRNTFYGDLGGSFEASGFALLLRGLPMWLLVFAPLVLAVRGFIGAVDWKALVDALAQGGDDVMSRIEGGNPGLGAAIVFAMLMAAPASTLAALLYPAFQAVCCAGGPQACALAISKCAHVCACVMFTPPMPGLSAMRSCSVSRWDLSARSHWLGLGVAASVGKVGCRWRDRGNARSAGGLCGHGARLFDDLSRYRAAVALAVGHGIAAIVRPFRAREGQGHRPASSALGEGLADALNVGSY